jgi:hypothetical protein
MTKINYQGVSKHMPYKIKELPEILHVDKKTIRRWITEKGLKTVPGSKHPILIRGSDLKQFLRDKDSKKKKIKLERHEFNCLHCKAARRAKRGSIKELNNRKTGLCSVCNGKMSRTFKLGQKDYRILSPPTQMSMFD